MKITELRVYNLFQKYSHETREELFSALTLLDENNRTRRIIEDIINFASAEQSMFDSLVRSGNTFILKKFVSQHGIMNPRPMFGITRFWTREFIDYLLNIGFSVHGSYIIYKAMMANCSLDIIEYLVSLGADVERAPGQNYVIEYAVTHNKLDYAAYLLDQGVNLFNLRRPILSLVLSPEMVDLLLLRGADVYEADETGKSFLDRMRDMPRNAIHKHLVSLGLLS